MNQTERETMMNSVTAVQDPVCGMDIELTAAAGASEYKAQTYYFCSAGCKEEFDLSPEQYVSGSKPDPIPSEQ